MMLCSSNFSVSECFELKIIRLLTLSLKGRLFKFEAQIIFEKMILLTFLSL